MSTQKVETMSSENTAGMTQEELKEMQKNIKEMPPEELAAFRNGFDPDEMGFTGEESQT